MLHFVAYDEPVPQGSKVAVVSKSTGKAFVKDQSEKSLHSWRDVVKTAARDAIDAQVRRYEDAEWHPVYPIEEPVVLAVTFTVYKPKSRPKTRVTFPDKAKDDIDKLLRAVMDAITAAGVWKDDGQVIELARLAKFYPVRDAERGTAHLGLGPGPAAMLCMGGSTCDVLASPGAVVRLAGISEFPDRYGAEYA
jgi:Holliday junction resolvase RusA-like endonuclease